MKKVIEELHKFSPGDTLTNQKIFLIILFVTLNMQKANNRKRAKGEGWGGESLWIECPLFFHSSVLCIKWVLISNHPAPNHHTRLNSDDNTTPVHSFTPCYATPPTERMRNEETRIELDALPERAELQHGHLGL